METKTYGLQKQLLYKSCTKNLKKKFPTKGIGRIRRAAENLTNVGLLVLLSLDKGKYCAHPPFNRVICW